MAKKSSSTGRKKVRTKTSVQRAQKKVSWKIPAGIFLLGILLYANTLTHDYTQDDAIVIYENMFTTEGVKGIPGLLTTDSFFGFFKVEGKSMLVAGGRYRPLTPVMFAIEWQLFGRSPWAGHLINILLYGITGIVLFYLLHWMGRHSRMAGRATAFAVAGAVLFMVHPLHTEAVANIKGRDEMMTFLLSILALWVLLRSLPKPTILNYVTAAGCLFLALLSKENAITFLLIVPLSIVFFTNASWAKALKHTLPLLFAAAAFLIIRGQVIGWSFGDTPRELMNNPFIKIVGNQYVDFNTGEKFATILYTLGKYVQLLFFPHPLTHDYYPRHIDIMQPGDWRVLLSLLVHAGMLFLAWTGYRNRQVWSYGILFYLITLSVVSNVVFPIGTNMSERFMYMPSLGWCIAIAALLFGTAWISRRAAWGLLIIVALAMSVRTIVRNPVWKNNYTLFTTDIHTSRNSAKLLVATGGELLAQYGANEERPGRLERINEALAYLQRAQSIHPNYKLAYLLQGNGHYYLQQWEPALAAYRTALRLDPEFADARRNLGLALRSAGRFYGEQQNDLDAAIRYLQQALEIMPEDYETVHGLGVAFGLKGDAARALQYFRRGVELEPENATAHFNLGLAYARIGDATNAQFHHDRAVALDPAILERRRSAGQ